MFKCIFLKSISFQNADINTFFQYLLMCLLQIFIWIQFFMLSQQKQVFALFK